MNNNANIPVYFLNPSYEEHNIDFYNLGILSIASHLQRQGIPAHIYMNYLDNECTVEYDYDKILPTILAKPHRYIGISCMTTQSQSALDLSKRIKQISPNTCIVWGGSHTNAFGEMLLQEHEVIDYCVRGFGERSSELLYRYLSGGNISPGNIPGLVYRKNGKIIKNESAEPEQDIYDQQFDYSLIVNFKPVERYFAGEPVKTVSVFNTIGCPYRCRFCINSVESTKIIFRDLEVVVQEIKQVLEKGADCVFCNSLAL